MLQMIFFVRFLIEGDQNVAVLNFARKLQADWLIASATLKVQNLTVRAICSERPDALDNNILNFQRGHVNFFQEINIWML